MTPAATLFACCRRRMSGGLEVDAVGVTGHGDGGPLEQREHMEGAVAEMLDWFRRIIRGPARPPAPLPAPSPAIKRDETSFRDVGLVAGATQPAPEMPKIREKAWKPAKAEFSDAERKAILACDPEAVSALASAITSELLKNIDNIPPFPIIASRLIEVLESSSVRTDIIERFVTQDAVIAAKVLRAANSPLYNPTSTIETLPLAIRIIGLTEVSRIAVAAAAAAVFDVEERQAHESVQQLQRVAWNHSLATARGSAWVALQVGEDVQRAYVAGLLHDIGKPVSLRGLGFALVNNRMQSPPPALVYAAIEEAHLDVGSMVADSWKLTDYLTEVVTEHHQPAPRSQLTRIIELVSAVDELRTNPAHREGLLMQIEELSVSFKLSQSQLGELEFELKKTALSQL